MKVLTLGKRLMNVNKWFCQSGHFKSHSKSTAKKGHINVIVTRVFLRVCIVRLRGQD